MLYANSSQFIGPLAALINNLLRTTEDALRAVRGFHRHPAACLPDASRDQTAASVGPDRDPTPASVCGFSGLFSASICSSNSTDVLLFAFCLSGRFGSGGSSCPANNDDRCRHKYTQHQSCNGFFHRSLLFVVLLLRKAGPDVFLKKTDNILGRCSGKEYFRHARVL